MQDRETKTRADILRGQRECQGREAARTGSSEVYRL